MQYKSPITELFTYPTCDSAVEWKNVIEQQHCRYLNKKCIKTRKSEPSISIGTCSVNYGKEGSDVIICPHRLLERRQIFTDSIHLLSLHEPGNELHIVSELSIPGGNVDYFIVSCKDGVVVDFVGIELQTLDTTGSIWPLRQKFLIQKEIIPADTAVEKASFGMNWKMTAKTILVQLHHKIDTFEHLGKHLVLVLQQELLDYMSQMFSFEHISKTASIGHSMHFHSYKMVENENCYRSIRLVNRYSTDSKGISMCLGLQAQAQVEMEIIVKDLQAKISERTLFTIV